MNKIIEAFLGAFLVTFLFVYCFLIVGIYSLLLFDSLPFLTAITKAFTDTLYIGIALSSIVGLFQVVSELKTEINRKKYERKKTEIKNTIRPRLDMLIEEARTKLKITGRQVINIELLEPSKPNSIFTSKIGGLPYLPKDFEYPKNGKGEFLHLLAQINLEEIPFKTLLPSSGILQFYILGDDSFGLELSSISKTVNDFKSQSYRIVYHQVITEPYVQDFSFIPPPEHMPFEREFGLIFKENYEYMSLFDYRINDYLDKSILEYFEYESEEISKALGLDLSKGKGTKLLGYPYFTQQDPRANESKYELLFQLDSFYNKSTKEWDIIWGDAGVGNFFITEEALKNLDFSEVIYNWDCS